jgi:long-subunit acyl-CoA synthetase (AMP-forming)
MARTDTAVQQPAAHPAATMCEAFQLTAAARPQEVAHRSFGDAVQITWAQYAARVRAIAGGLHRLGIRHGDTVALMLVNRPEFDLVTEWLPGGEELTPTMKLKRKSIESKYAAQIERLYRD